MRPATRSSVARGYKKVENHWSSSTDLRAFSRIYYSSSAVTMTWRRRRSALRQSVAQFCDKTSNFTSRNLQLTSITWYLTANEICSVNAFDTQQIIRNGKILTQNRRRHYRVVNKNRLWWVPYVGLRLRFYVSDIHNNWFACFIVLYHTSELQSSLTRSII